MDIPQKNVSGDESEFTQVEVDTFTIGDDPQFTDEPLGNGMYAYAFEFMSPTEDSVLSNFIMFTVEDGQITTNVDVQ